ncbi:uncharacterized protein LOC106472981 [Limulus polyphemus]|uniref:Uncharacterized protein LOC106472981 n=1 Tax=Limulus polyphemus TaxID=6850 RepID=A0ABM1TMV3_LIMPO|nr:uncharacterized protein LOC106472981 [Limulus polyphemus]
MQSRIRIILCGLTLCGLTFATNVIGDLEDQRTLYSDPNFILYLKEVLENLRKIMPIGVPGAQIPVLDPFEIPDNINIYVQEGVADFQLNFEKKFKIEGLSKFVLQKLDADLAKLYTEGEVVLPKLTATGRYRLDGKVLVFPLYGNGDFRIEVDNAIAFGRFQVKNVNNRLKVEQLSLNANADKIQVQLDNLLDPKLSPVLNQIINDLGKTVFDKFQPVVMDLLSKILPPLIDKEIGKFTVDEIISGKFIP